MPRFRYISWIKFSLTKRLIDRFASDAIKASLGRSLATIFGQIRFIFNAPFRLTIKGSITELNSFLKHLIIIKQ